MSKKSGTTKRHVQLVTMLRSHVEVALAEIWENSDLDVDDDGDYPFRSETGLGWVHVHPCEEPLVRVYAFAAHGVPESKKMLREINELNARARWSKVSYDDGLVVVEECLHWTEVDADSLARALESVVAVSDDIGPLFAGVFGGHTTVPVGLADDEAAA